VIRLLPNAMAIEETLLVNIPTVRGKTQHFLMYRAIGTTVDKSVSIGSLSRSGSEKVSPCSVSFRSKR
jgi:D-aminopeptidase